MKNALLIADSGGTRTDWCLIDPNGKMSHFETDSYHPKYITPAWIDNKRQFWNEYRKDFSLEVKFYGAGCLSRDNQVLLKNAFEEWGIAAVEIQSDILAAAMACFGEEDGLVGILGTGSVIGSVESGQVKEVFGGLGYLLGDEGSGYYFGKMLLQKFLKNQFTEQTMKAITAEIGNREQVIKEAYSGAGKEFIGQLAARFSKSMELELKDLHEENIRLFFETYVPRSKKFNKIDLVGTYASANEDLIRKILADYDFEVGVILQKPINKLADYYRNRHF